MLEKQLSPLHEHAAIAMSLNIKRLTQSPNARDGKYSASCVSDQMTATLISIGDNLNRFAPTERLMRFQAIEHQEQLPRMLACHIF